VSRVSFSRFLFRFSVSTLSQRPMARLRSYLELREFDPATFLIFLIVRCSLFLLFFGQISPPLDSFMSTAFSFLATFSPLFGYISFCYVFPMKTFPLGEDFRSNSIYRSFMGISSFSISCSFPPFVPDCFFGCLIFCHFLSSLFPPYNFSSFLFLFLVCFFFSNFFFCLGTVF